MEKLLCVLTVFIYSIMLVSCSQATITDNCSAESSSDLLVEESIEESEIGLPDESSEGVSESPSQDVSEERSEGPSEEMSEEASEEASEEVSEEASEEASEEVSEENNGEILEQMKNMTLFEKVCQMFIIRHDSLVNVSKITVSDEKTQKALEEYPVGGVIYFAPNIQTPEQCREMIEKIQSYSAIPLFIAVDEEGGTVARIGNNEKMGTTAFDSMGNIKTAEEAYSVGFTIGTEIQELGFNLDFAPVADVNSNPSNTVIGKRAFSSDHKEAARMVASCVEGFVDSGIYCTLKHFPGHGGTSTDSHKGYTQLNKSLTELEEAELLPFASGVKAGASFVMLGHIALPQITGNSLPASLSGEIISILKNKIGFDGIVITDSLSMDAIENEYTSAQAAVYAVKAGVDILLMPEDFKQAVNAVIQAVNDGGISEERINESVYKILKAKERFS